MAYPKQIRFLFAFPLIPSLTALDWLVNGDSSARVDIRRNLFITQQIFRDDISGLAEKGIKDLRSFPEREVADAKPCRRSAWEAGLGCCRPQHRGKCEVPVIVGAANDLT